MGNESFTTSNHSWIFPALGRAGACLALLAAHDSLLLHPSFIFSLRAAGPALVRATESLVLEWGQRCELGFIVSEHIMPYSLLLESVIQKLLLVVNEVIPLSSFLGNCHYSQNC